MWFARFTLAPLILATFACNTANASEPTPFSMSDFCVLSATGKANSRFKIEYQPRPRAIRGRVWETHSEEAPPRLDGKIPTADIVVKTQKPIHLPATMTTSLGGDGQACAWNRDGRQLEEQELVELSQKPTRAIILWEKPADWSKIEPYALYLDPAVIFVFPGPLLANIEQAER